MMELLPKELEEQLPSYGSTEGLPTVDKIVYVHYFHPMSGWDWYAMEYDPVDRIFFGFVHGFEDEFGDFSLDEMEEIDIGGLKLERDLYFAPIKFSELLKEKGLNIIAND